MDTNKENVLANIPNTFVITYYADKHQKLITRRGRKDEGCKFKFSKNGKPCFTYFDLDANGYRTANLRIQLLKLVHASSSAVQTKP